LTADLSAIFCGIDNAKLQACPGKARRKRIVVNQVRESRTVTKHFTGWRHYCKGYFVDKVQPMAAVGGVVLPSCCTACPQQMQGQHSFNNPFLAFGNE
jgi:hypothetical protein